jgi:hypothetical protein
MVKSSDVVFWQWQSNILIRDRYSAKQPILVKYQVPVPIFRGSGRVRTGIRNWKGVFLSLEIVFFLQRIYQF